MVSPGNHHFKKKSPLESNCLIFHQFEAHLSSLYKMLNLIKIEALQCNIPIQKIRKMELAAEEVIMNIISYAYPNNDSVRPIKLSCSVLNSIFEIHIKDKGIPFNPLNMKKKINLPFDPNNPISGGLGILLIKKYCDHIFYQYVKNENWISLQFFLVKV
ncbi:ATP-binding protein [Candidatus Clavichlamydia salmonicola]|uniref:ATP-binding protein n=1 Tax=Candidatus Clavichlamydia salmonicola TaxID=469812 RepID=UPI0018911078|nr:ATP-binding protein [Candidatus Clavichlamydia salmonicola]